MRLFLLRHTHAPGECAASYAAWRGTESPLRHNAAVSSCVHGEHTVWWIVEAADATAALALLPPFVAARSEAVAVQRVVIP